MSLYLKYYPDKFDTIGNFKPNEDNIKKINSHKFEIKNSRTVYEFKFRYENIICKICNINAHIREKYEENRVLFYFVEGGWLVKDIINCEEVIMRKACT